jgi:hypothetical protein
VYLANEPVKTTMKEEGRGGPWVKVIRILPTSILFLFVTILIHALREGGFGLNVWKRWIF